MRNKDRIRFLHAAMRVIHQTEFVLNLHGIPREGGAPMDLGPHISAMLRVCGDQHLDERPIEHLRQVARAVDGLRGPTGGGDLKAGLESAVEFEQWLASTFPGAFARIREEALERTRKHALN